MTRKRRKLPSPAPSEVFEGRRLRPRTTSRLANGSQDMQAAAPTIKRTSPRKGRPRPLNENQRPKSPDNKSQSKNRRNAESQSTDDDEFSGANPENIPPARFHDVSRPALEEEEPIDEVPINLETAPVPMNPEDPHPIMDYEVESCVDDDDASEDILTPKPPRIGRHDSLRSMNHVDNKGQHQSNELHSVGGRGTAQNKSHHHKGRKYNENDSYESISDDVNEMEAEGDDNSEDDSRPRVPHRRGLQTAEKVVDKGKRRAYPPNQVVADDVIQHRFPPTADEEVALLREDWSTVSGPFPSAAKKAAVQLGRKTRLEAARIAQLYKKTSREVLVHAGLGERISRLNGNPPNKFRTWYTVHHPKPRNISLADFDKEMIRAYLEILESLDVPDEAAGEETLRHGLDFSASRAASGSPDDQVTVSTLSRMRTAIDRFEALASTYHNSDDIEIIGAIVYTGPDTIAKQLTTIFAGSNTVQRLTEKFKVQVGKLLNKLAAGIKSVDLWRDTFKLLTPFDHEHDFVDVDCRVGETPRDRDRRVFTAMMQKNLEAFEGAVSKKMHWKDWLNTAWRHHLCIINWPDQVSPPGPDFIWREVKAQDMKALVSNYIEKAKNPSSNLIYPTIVRWSDDEISMNDNDSRKGRIALVRSRGNIKLRKLSDCKEWLQRFGVATVVNADDLPRTHPISQSEAAIGDDIGTAGSSRQSGVVHAVPRPVPRLVKAHKIQVPSGSGMADQSGNRSRPTRPASDEDVQMIDGREEGYNRRTADLPGKSGFRSVPRSIPRIIKTPKTQVASGSRIVDQSGNRYHSIRPAYDEHIRVIDEQQEGDDIDNADPSGRSGFRFLPRPTPRPIKAHKAQVPADSRTVDQSRVRSRSIRPGSDEDISMVTEQEEVDDIGATSFSGSRFISQTAPRLIDTQKAQVPSSSATVDQPSVRFRHTRPVSDDDVRVLDEQEDWRRSAMAGRSFTYEEMNGATMTKRAPSNRRHHQQKTLEDDSPSQPLNSSKSSQAMHARIVKSNSMRMPDTPVDYDDRSSRQPLSRAMEEEYFVETQGLYTPTVKNRKGPGSGTYIAHKTNKVFKHNA